MAVVEEKAGQRVAGTSTRKLAKVLDTMHLEINHAEKIAYSSLKMLWK